MWNYPCYYSSQSSFYTNIHHYHLKLWSSQIEEKIHTFTRGQIYCTGLVLETIYQTWFVLKHIIKGVCYLRGAAIAAGGRACTVIDNSGLSAYRHSSWRDMVTRRERRTHTAIPPGGTWLSRREGAMPPLVLAGHANVGSPATGSYGTRWRLPGLHVEGFQVWR